MAVMQGPGLRWLVLAALCFCATGCGSGGEDASDSIDLTADDDHSSGCAAPCFAEVSTDGPVLYVAECQGKGTGTQEDPYSSLADAVAAAAAGTTIVVSNGVFPAELVVDKSLTIVGCGPEETTLVAPGELPAIMVNKTADVVLEDFSVTVEIAAYGLVVSESQDVHLRDLRVSGSGLGAGGAGITVMNSQGVTIGSTEEGTEGDKDAGCHVQGTLGYGLYVEASKVRIVGNQVEGAAAGGIVLKDVHGLAGGKAAIRDNLVRAFLGAGISVYGGEVELSGNEIKDAQATDQTTPVHGISVVALEDEPAIASISWNTIEDCAGAGLLLHGVVADEVADNVIRRTANGGIVLQQGSTAPITGNLVEHVQLGGIILNAGTSGDLRHNTIKQVEEGGMFDFQIPGIIPWAFGIAVVGARPDGAVLLEGNQVSEAAFAGVLVSQSTHEHVAFGEGNVVAGNLEAGIALQDGAQTLAAAHDLETLVSFSSPEQGLEGNGPTGNENVVIGTSYLGE